MRVGQKLIYTVHMDTNLQYRRVYDVVQQQRLEQRVAQLRVSHKERPRLLWVRDNERLRSAPSGYLF